MTIKILAHTQTRALTIHSATKVTLLHFQMLQKLFLPLVLTVPLLLQLCTEGQEFGG